MSFGWWHFPKQVLDQRAANGGKGVAVVKAKGRELVALPAKVQDFTQGDSDAREDPQIFCAGAYPSEVGLWSAFFS